MNPEKFGGLYDGGESVEGSKEIVFAVPEEHQIEGWAKDLKSYPDVWTKLAGSEKLIGQKIEGKIDLLKEDSSPEEINTFYKSLGRPDEAKNYSFDRTGQSEQLQKYNSDESDNVVKEIFHKWGLNGKQATGIQKDYEAIMDARLSEQIENQKKQDAHFEELTIKTFGQEKDAIIESSKILLEKFAPEGFGEKIKSLDSETLTVLAGVINNLKKTYISEDAFGELNKGSTGSGGESEQELRAQAMKIMVSEEWTNPFHSKNKEAKDEVNALYKKIGEME